MGIDPAMRAENALSRSTAQMANYLAGKTPLKENLNASGRQVWHFGCQSVYIEAQSSPDDERVTFLPMPCGIRNLGRAPNAAIGPLLADYQWSWP